MGLKAALSAVAQRGFTNTKKSTRTLYYDHMNGRRNDYDSCHQPFQSYIDINVKRGEGKVWNANKLIQYDSALYALTLTDYEGHIYIVDDEDARCPGHKTKVQYMRYDDYLQGDPKKIALYGPQTRTYFATGTEEQLFPYRQWCEVNADRSELLPIFHPRKLSEDKVSQEHSRSEAKNSYDPTHGTRRDDLPFVYKHNNTYSKIKLNHNSHGSNKNRSAVGVNHGAHSELYTKQFKQDYAVPMHARSTDHDFDNFKRDSDLSRKASASEWSDNDNTTIALGDEPKVQRALGSSHADSHNGKPRALRQSI